MRVSDTGAKAPRDTAKPRVVIRAREDLSADERAQVDGLLRAVFPTEEPTGWHWADDDWEVGVWVGGLLVSRLGIVERTGSVGGHDLRLGGVGGVGTLPDYRERGYARLALLAAESFIREQLRADFGLLVCSGAMVGYYERLGWRTVAGPLVFEQPEGPVTFEGAVMMLPAARRDWPAGEIDLRGLPW
jgi:aminoglycoside 2'-N-acetyltransferase I